MIVVILGWLWIILGTIFFLKPEAFRRWLLKKGIRRIRKTLFFITLGLSLLFIAIAFRYSGIAPKILAVAGIIGLIKAAIFLKEKTAEAVMQWWSRQPVSFLRLGAVVQIVLGILIVILH